jgi:hypothetical protein
MKAWEEDKSWSDCFVDEIRLILAPWLIRVGTNNEDQKQNTDLVVMRTSDMSVACRVRQHYYWVRWPDDITFRAARPSGVRTEIQKVIRGQGRYMFYGFANEDGTRLYAWMLIDLDEFRQFYARWLQDHKGNHPGKILKNTDGTWFLAINLKTLPPEAILARKKGAKP